MSEEHGKHELTVAPNLQLGALEVAPDAVIDRASKIATSLAGIINGRNLYQIIRSRKYVVVEGWTTLGAMLGVVPRTVGVIEIQKGIFEATVELVRASDGAVIGRGIAECGADDELDKYGKPIWADRPRYARKSMAITRATGKAFRLSFSWVMKLAGFEPTPAEEMTGEVIEGETRDIDEKTTASKTKEASDVLFGEAEKTAHPPAMKSWPGYYVGALVENKLAEHPKNAVNILNLFPDLPRNLAKEKVVMLGEIYRQRRDDNGLDIVQAAETAWAEWTSWNEEN